MNYAFRRSREKKEETVNSEVLKGRGGVMLSVPLLLLLRMMRARRKLSPLNTSSSG